MTFLKNISNLLITSTLLSFKSVIPGKNYIKKCFYSIFLKNKLGNVIHVVQEQDKDGRQKSAIGRFTPTMLPNAALINVLYYK